MKSHRFLIGLSLTLGLAGVAYVAQQGEPSGLKMTAAAERFLAGLTPQQRAKTLFAFEDAERMNWHFIPLQDKDRKPTRKGLPLGEMSGEQRQAALDLLKAGTSPQGDRQATTIMSLENILHELERGGSMVRHPGWYFFSVFGRPSRTEKWGWRVEGHHLSLNFMVDAGKVVGASPAFFGANPATVKAGPRQGLETLPEAERLALQLFEALDENRKKVARQEHQFPEIAGRTAGPHAGAPRGLAAADMTAKQRDMLVRLIEAYAARMPADVAEIEIRRVRDAGVERVYFAFAGGVEAGKPHTYRVQGPSFVIEFLNVQADSAHNPANHIHSVWRTIPEDFGVTALQ
jgi:hypothetical protein